MPILSKTCAAALFAAALAAAGATGCSFVVESRDRQCESDEDCAGFDGATCDEGVCVAREGTAASTSASTSASSTSASSTTSTGTGGCEGPDGCFSCEPIAQVDFLNACTDAACVPYDNAQLEGLLLEDGSVPPVP